MTDLADNSPPEATAVVQEGLGGSVKPKLTEPQRALLAAVNKGDGWRAIFDQLHRNHKPTAITLRDLGLVTYTDERPLIEITDAGRAALGARP